MGVKRSRTHIDWGLWKDPPAHHCGGCLREGSHQRCTRARDQHKEEQGTPALYTNSRNAREPMNQQKSKEPLNINGGGGASQAPGAPHRGPLRPMVTRDVLAFFKIPQKVLILTFLENAIQRYRFVKLIVVWFTQNTTPPQYRCVALASNWNIDFVSRQSLFLCPQLQEKDSNQNLIWWLVPWCSTNSSMLLGLGPY